MLKDYLIEVRVKRANKNVFARTYRIALRDEFVNGDFLKAHTLQNHVNNFIKQVKLNSLPTVERTFAKREIYAVDYGINTGSEINGIRPSLIYKIQAEKGV